MFDPSFNSVSSIIQEDPTLQIKRLPDARKLSDRINLDKHLTTDKLKRSSITEATGLLIPPELTASKIDRPV